MNTYDLLPVFHQLEPNNLKGAQPGFVISQMNAVKGDSIINTTAVKGARYVENGMLAQITKAGYKAADGKEAVLFLVYSEVVLSGLQYRTANFATDIDAENARLIQLIPGDEWTTDIAPTEPAYAAEIEAGHIAEVTGAEGDYSRDDFLTTTTLADGTAAHHYIYLG